MRTCSTLVKVRPRKLSNNGCILSVFFFDDDDYKYSEIWWTLHLAKRVCFTGSNNVLKEEQSKSEVEDHWYRRKIGKQISWMEIKCCLGKIKWGN